MKRIALITLALCCSFCFFSTCLSVAYAGEGFYSLSREEMAEAKEIIKKIEDTSSSCQEIQKYSEHWFIIDALSPDHEAFARELEYSRLAEMLYAGKHELHYEQMGTKPHIIHRELVHGIRPDCFPANGGGWRSIEELQALAEEGDRIKKLHEDYEEIDLLTEKLDKTLADGEGNMKKLEEILAERSKKK